MDTFGKRLRECREAAKLSQQALAKELGTSYTVIGKYERDEMTPSVEVALKLAKILGVSLDFLSGYTDLELDQSTVKRIEDISKMKDTDRSFILKTIDALVRDFKAQKAYA